MTSGTQLSYPESVIKICGVEVGKRAFHRLDALTVHPCLVSSILASEHKFQAKGEEGAKALKILRTSYANDSRVSEDGVPRLLRVHS